MNQSHTPASDRLSEYLNSAPGQEAYIQWLGSSFTQMMLAAGREQARPRPLDAMHSADARLGETLGANAIVDFFGAPFVFVGQGIIGAKKLPARTYGVVPELKITKKEEETSKT